MALSNVFMKDTDGNIAKKGMQFTDEICGLLFDISAQSTFWTKTENKKSESVFKDTIVKIKELADMEDHKELFNGIPYYHIKQFFDIRGGEGTLYIAFADCSNGWTTLIDMQKAADGTINQFGIWTEQNLWSNMDESGETYTVNLVNDLNNVAKNMADNYFAPASILLSANSSQIKTSSGTEKKVVFSKIPSCISTARYVTVLLSQSMDDDVRKMQATLESTTPVGVVGLALGAVSKASVGESIAWVAKFDLADHVQSIEMGFGDAETSGSYITNSTQYDALTNKQLDTLDDNGYVFMCKYAGKEGHIYFNKDRSCSDGDFCTISRNRTINKSRRGVRAALLPFVNSPLKVDPGNGNLTSAQVTVFTNTITDVLKAMATAEEISAIGSVKVPANQNVLVTKKLNLSYSIIPLGTAEAIYVEEGLAIKK